MRVVICQVLRSLSSHHAHRLAVVALSGGAKRLVGVITQTSIVRFVAKHMDMLAPVADLTMTSFVRRPSSSGAAKEASSSAGDSVLTVPVTATAREALRTIVEARVSGVPVVDTAERIVANFSASDVRLLAHISNQADADAALSLPVCGVPLHASCICMWFCCSLVKWFCSVKGGTDTVLDVCRH